MAKLFDQQQLSAGVQEFEEHLRRVRARDWSVDCQLAKPRNDLPPPPRREAVRKAAARNARGTAPAKEKARPAGLPMETFQSRRLILALAALVLVGFAGAMSLALTDGGAPTAEEQVGGRVRYSFHRPEDQPSDAGQPSPAGQPRDAGQDGPRCFRAGFRDQRDIRGDNPAGWVASPGHDAARDRRDATGHRGGSISRRDLRHYQERRAVGAGAFRPGRGERARRNSRGRETGEETDRRARQSRERQSSGRRWRPSRDRRQSRRLRPRRGGREARRAQACRRQARRRQTARGFRRR